MSDNRSKSVKSSDLELKDKVVHLNRVTKVTKGGRTFTFAATVVVGDGNGVVGHGLGKSKEVQEAIAKGIDDAKKNLVRVPVRQGTIPHVQEGRFAGAKVLLKPAAHGTGVIASAILGTAFARPAPICCSWQPRQPRVSPGMTFTKLRMV